LLTAWIGSFISKQGEGKMKVTRFIVKNVADKGTRKIIYSGTLDFEVLTGSCRIRNMRPFQIEIDEAGMTHNYSDRLMVRKKFI